MARAEISLWPVPADFETTACKGCGAIIAWGKTDKGRNVPLSMNSPHVARDKSGTPIQAPSHFQECPAANQFSGRNRK